MLSTLINYCQIRCLSIAPISEHYRLFFRTGTTPADVFNKLNFEFFFFPIHSVLVFLTLTRYITVNVAKFVLVLNLNGITVYVLNFCFNRKTACEFWFKKKYYSSLNGSLDIVVMPRVNRIRNINWNFSYIILHFRFSLSVFIIFLRLIYKWPEIPHPTFRFGYFFYSCTIHI